MHKLTWSIAIALVFTFSNELRADQPTEGNYLVANGEVITEYTPSGGIVQQWTVPPPVVGYDVTLRDLVLDSQGRIHVMVRSGDQGFENYLSTLDTKSNSWVHHTMPDWTHAGVTYYGGIGIDGNHVFATDQETANDDTDGVIRFPLDDLSASIQFQEEPFGDPIWHQATVGLDGYLYILARHGTFRKIDATNFGTVSEINVFAGSSVMGAVVAENGDIYTVDLSNNLHHFNSNGGLIESVAVTGDTDMELAADGTLLVGSAGDTLTVMNLADLSLQTVFDTSAQDRGGSFDRNFVTIVGYEPATTVTPTSFQITRGIHNGGSLADLLESDNSDLTAVRNSADIQSRVFLEVSSISPVEAPSELTFTLESAVFARSSVIQAIDLFNYQTGQFEEVDSRAASRFIDQVTSVTPTGDLSRFVETGNRAIRARVRFHSPNARQQFAANVDQTVWTIDD